MSENKPLTRHEEQEKALFCLYDALTYVDMGEEVDVEDIASGLLGVPYSEVSPYIKGIFIYGLKHYDEIVKKVDETLKGWTFSRRSRIEQAVYLFAFALYYGNERTEKPIVIDVSLKLVKKYGEEKDAKIVNAILDKVLV